MITFLLPLNILLSIALSESLHFEDCLAFDFLCHHALISSGISIEEHPECAIMETGDFIIYFAGYRYDYYSESSIDDLHKLVWPIVSAGVVSSNTTWHSDYVYVMFENVTFVISTEMARDAARMEDNYSAEDILYFVLDNVQEHYK